MAEDHGDDRADSPHPEDAANEAGDGEAARSAGRKKNGRGLGVECGIESGVEPAQAIAALDGRILNLQSAIGTRLHVIPGIRGWLLSNRLAVRASRTGLFNANDPGFIGVEVADTGAALIHRIRRKGIGSDASLIVRWSRTVGKSITAFNGRRRAQSLFEQVCTAAISRARTQLPGRSGETLLRALRTIVDHGGVVSSEGADGCAFVCGHSCPEKIGDGDGRKDQEERYGGDAQVAEHESGSGHALAF
jgi:hypothetical protein